MNREEIQAAAWKELESRAEQIAEVEATIGELTAEEQDEAEMIIKEMYARVRREIITNHPQTRAAVGCVINDIMDGLADMDDAQ